MAKTRNRRLNAEEVMKLHKDLTGLGTVDGYAPANPKLSVENIRTLMTHMAEAQEAATLAEHAFNLALEAQIAAEWAVNDAMIDARAQVAAQFGRDSREVEAVGLTRLSDRKRPVRKKKDDKPGSKTGTGDSKGKVNGSASASAA